MKTILFSLSTLFITSCSSQVQAADAPLVVATPPADASRGLIRVSAKEIRHYGGNKSKSYLVSYDNGLNWQEKALPPSFPAQQGGLHKEAPAFTAIPGTNEFVRTLSIRGRVMISKGVLDGQWTALPAPSWQKPRKDRKTGKTITDPDFRPGGILRNPTFVNGGKRLLIPAHGGGSYVWYTDDLGKNWARSNKVIAPHHQIGGIHKGKRWNHGAVEPTIIELKDGRLWMICRTAQDMHYESFSSNFGKTWSKAIPSRFYGTITMPTIGRLKDGRLLILWSNTMSLPELIRTNAAAMKKLGRKARGGEDAFTNRDVHHAAISSDEGKTWSGFREIILDELRNNGDYATRHSSEDRGKHQSEFVELDNGKVLVALGQHSLHRRLVIFDTAMLYEKKRSDNFSEGLKHWSVQKYLPKIKGHCAYQRKQGGVFDAENKTLQLRRPVDAEAVNVADGADYQNDGASWNFPAGKSGVFSCRIRLNKGGQGAVINLVDRWFNPSDITTEKFAMFSLKVDGSGKLGGKQLLTPGKWQQLSLQWTAVSGSSECHLLVDGKDSGLRLPLRNTSLNGISYVHFISAATKTDSAGFSLKSVSAEVK